MTGDELVVSERREAAALIRVNRERKLNAMNRQMIESITAHLDDAARDPAVRAVIITGTGRAFIAGADIGEYWQKGAGVFAEYQLLGRQLLERIEHHPKPVIAAVNGLALGGGFEVALACDLIVADESAVFGLPEPRLGLVPGGGGTQRLTREVGRHRAMEIVLTGRRLSAIEARDWGLVAAVTAPGGVEEGASALAARISELAPLAVGAAKRLITEGLDASLGTALSYEQQTLLALYATADGQEGINAFMEKRDARFIGT